MTKPLDRADWDRVLHALSQFQHNPDYKVTFEKVLQVLETCSTKIKDIDADRDQ